MPDNEAEKLPTDDEWEVGQEKLREEEEEMFRRMEREIRANLVKYKQQIDLIPERISDIFNPALKALNVLNESMTDYIRIIYGGPTKKNALECEFCRGTGVINLWKPVEGIEEVTRIVPCKTVARKCPVCKGTGIH